METLKAGSLAYYDGIRGLIGCKVIRVWKDSQGILTCSVKITDDDNAAYRKDSLLETTCRWVVPRKSVVGKYKTTVLPYNIEVTE